MVNKIFKYPNGKKISYTIYNQKSDVFLVYLHGLLSSKASEKGQKIFAFAKKHKFGFLSVDYTAHGDSDGERTEFRVGQCLKDVCSVIDSELKDKKLILIGSSLGGWLSLLLAELKSNQVKGVMTLAVAADFTKLVWEYMFTDEVRELLKSGKVLGPNDATKGHCFTYQMFEEAEMHCLLHRTIKYDGPVLLVHGDRDETIPYKNSLQVMERLSSTKVCVQIIKSEHHLLSGYNLSDGIMYLLSQI